jgi:transcriptional regulator with XRE-family HTH domain
MEIFNLKEFWERHGITQKEVCFKTGIRQATLLEIERGYRPFSTERASEKKYLLLMN